MPNQGQQFSALRMDIESVLKPFDDEQQYLRKLRHSTTVEPILHRLFDLLNVHDYRVLFSSINRQKLDYKWLEIFSKLCMKRYLELDDIFFSENNLTNKNKSESNSLSTFDSYISYLKENFKNFFSIHHYHAIIYEFEQLSQFKIEQISIQLNKNNEIIQKLFSLVNNPTNENENENDDQCNIIDDSIIHISSTPAQPIYLNYKPIHMIYLRTNVLIKNDHNLEIPRRGITNTFVADLKHTKTIHILDEKTGKTYDIPTKYIYFANPSERNIILPLKLRVLIIDPQTKSYRYGIIGEEPAKSNQYRCLVFFPDGDNLSASYHPSSDIHICFDQTIDYENDFLKYYFKSYPERMMLRAKEGTFVKIRNPLSANRNVFVQAVVLQIDCSMILIEICHTKQRMWIYRGSTLIEQMNNYYSTQNNSDNRTFRKQSARQHLSAKKSNAPEIICLNDQMKNKTNRNAESNLDNIRSAKRTRVSIEQEFEKNLTTESRINRSDQQNNAVTTISRTKSSTFVVSSVTSRSSANTNAKVIVNPLFLELAESFLLHYSKDFMPHYCSNKCVMYAEKYFYQLPRTMNPYLKPLACQWTILESIRIKKSNDVRVKYSRPIVIYCAPCGRKLYNESQIDHYLYTTKSRLTIELFVFDSSINIKQYFCSDGKVLSSDISHGQENVPISAVNEVDDDVPSPFTYRVERTPVEGVNMILNEPTMTCCTCTDGCRDRTRCACWLRTLKYAELIGDERVKSMRAKNKSQAEILYQLGYGFRRLHKNVPGGIYECNSRCACAKETCSNRVVQNGIIAQLQLFKTPYRGWGVRALHDIPLGTFISVYSGEIFTSEQADERGKLIGDEYQADLDFFENINNDSYEGDEEDNSDHHYESDNDENEENKILSTNSETMNARLGTLRSREILNKKDSKNKNTSKSTKTKNETTSTLNRTLLPDYDGVVYTLDAKLVGNIGRYFNHSCSPNIAVQNVFVDTHDIHFPWIGFFTTKSVRAGTELCWDYNYTVGEIAGRRMDCYCGSAECRRRVL